MMRSNAAILVCVLAGSFVMAQEPDTKTLFKEFGRSVKSDDITLSFVLLNNRTVDVLFQAPGKYAVRARANQSTTFYVQGMPEKDMVVDTKFFVEQDGHTYEASSLNIKNFDGNTVTKGTRVDGMIQLGTKLDLTHPFTVRGSHGSVEFVLSPEALKLAEPAPAAAPPPE
ncbi:MAG: hypothetical protein HXY20_06505 [Acidobacteria bacterium]|nr:hypothetical protein [Acidobacteriota bacterium]